MFNKFAFCKASKEDGESAGLTLLSENKTPVLIRTDIFNFGAMVAYDTDHGRDTIADQKDDLLIEPDGRHLFFATRDRGERPNIKTIWSVITDPPIFEVVVHNSGPAIDASIWADPNIDPKAVRIIQPLDELQKQLATEIIAKVKEAVGPTPYDLPRIVQAVRDAYLIYLAPNLHDDTPDPYHVEMLIKSVKLHYGVDTLNAGKIVEITTRMIDDCEGLDEDEDGEDYEF